MQYNKDSIEDITWKALWFQSSWRHAILLDIIDLITVSR